MRSLSDIISEKYSKRRILKKKLEVYGLWDKEAKLRGFGNVNVDYGAGRKSAWVDIEKDAEGRFMPVGKMEDKSIAVGSDVLDFLCNLNMLWPGPVHDTTTMGTTHERNHLIRHSGDKIANRQVEQEIAKNGSPLNGQRREFAIEVFNRLKNRYARESQANIQAVVERLNEPGMTVETVKDEIATFMWIFYGQGEKISEDVEHELNENFPWLKCKRDVLHKARQMDLDYLRKQGDLRDTEIGPLSFGQDFMNMLFDALTFLEGKRHGKESKVKKIISDEAKRHGFDRTSISEWPAYKKFCLSYRIKNGEIEPERGRLNVGSQLLEELSDIYQELPEEFYAIVEFGIHRESGRANGPASVGKIVKKQVEREIRKDGYSPKDKNGLVMDVLNDLNCYAERESQANLQATAGYLNDPGRTVKKLKADLGAVLWKQSVMWGIGTYEDSLSYDCDVLFPWIKPECKDEIVKNALEIDGEYRALLDKSTTRRVS